MLLLRVFYFSLARRQLKFALGELRQRQRSTQVSLVICYREMPLNHLSGYFTTVLLGI